MSTLYPFARPLYLMLKPVGSQCNLACDYCYYLEKSFLYAGSNRQFMSDDLLEQFIKEYISSQTTPKIHFTWHGGEPLLMPLSFYKRAVQLQKRYANGRLINNCIQTNGTLLTEEWCEFLADNHWLVGISIDGDISLHDKFRKNKYGFPSFHKVMKGIEMLNRYHVEWNAMAVVNSFNADYPLDFYRFFKEINCRYIQFTPVVERYKKHSNARLLASIDDTDIKEVSDLSVTPAQWGEFLCSIFDEWVRNDVGEYFIQIFDSALANWMGVSPSVCSLAKTCGHAAVMEHNGDVYSCDHFVFPQYKLGNIRSSSILEMMNSDKQKSFGLSKQSSLPLQCRRCDYLFACNGECPKNRFCYGSDGEYGLNYLCKGYYRFFSHVAPYMEFMKNELLNERPPSNIMEHLKS